jgi:SAM-dependent methyltransferase
MTFKDLVAMRAHLLSQYNTDPIVTAVQKLENQLTSFGDDKTDITQGFESEVISLVNDLNRIHTNLKFNRDRYNDLLERVEDAISVESTKFLTDNYSLELKVEAEAVGNIRKVRVLSLSKEVLEEIELRVGKYSIWQFPTLEIGCRDGEWTKLLVAGDPLYITDHYRDFLESAVEQFTPEYQNRIRPYLTRDADLSMLPQGQFGFVFCWNFLNYRSMDTIKEYLKSVKELLRPGGTFMFSYNNGDIPKCAGYVEWVWMSYIPKRMLVPLCESLGFEITAAPDYDESGTAISWIELRKPGVLYSPKKQQVLGEIKTIDR